MTNPELEEKLREAACFGDIDGVKELLLRGVNVNAQHDINGWTALHWAAKRNHLNIVNLLCNHGADKNIPTNKGEVAAQLTGEGVIKVLLNAMKGSTPKVQIKKEESPKPLAITPNYLRSPPLAYEVDLGEPRPGKKQKLNGSSSKEYLHQEQRELILKLRMANQIDQDFIEIELPTSALTLEYLIVMGCEELGIQANCVDRVRKLPNTRIRRDREVERLQDYQEIEFVVKEMVSESVEQLEQAEEVEEGEEAMVEGEEGGEAGEAGEADSQHAAEGVEEQGVESAGGLLEQVPATTGVAA